VTDLFIISRNKLSMQQVYHLSASEKVSKKNPSERRRAEE
jgi:hypothetical protein